MTEFHLRLAIPVHDVGERFARFVQDVVETAPSGFAADIVAVDDGSAPELRRAHEEAIAAAAHRLRAVNARHRVRLVASTSNRGKGAAIRLGWGDGTGATWLGFVDGDGAAPAREVWRAAGSLDDRTGCDALLAARVPAPERVVHRTFLRGLQGRVFSGLVDRLLDLGVRDPQCGLKFFRASALAPLLPRLREERWLLDAELLLHLRNRGARLAELPIDWTESTETGLVFLVDPLKMASGLLRIRRRVGVVPRRDIVARASQAPEGRHARRSMP